jgi:hypothetical protein
LQLCPSLAILLSLRGPDRRCCPVHERSEFPDVRPPDAVDWRFALSTTETLAEHSDERVASGCEELTTGIREADRHGDRGQHEIADDGAQ